MKFAKTIALLSGLLAQSLLTQAKDVACKQESLGYPCCDIKNTHVYSEDKDGKWGFNFENNQWCGISTIPKKGSFYTVFTDVPVYKIFDDKYDEVVDSRIQQFSEVISKNLYTYDDQSDLEQLKAEIEASGNDEVPRPRSYYISHLYEYADKSVYQVYLNENILDEVRALPNVYLVESGIKLNRNVPTIDPEEEEYINCTSEQRALGYSCCKKNNTKVYAQDKRGDWGFDFENKDWCGLAAVPVTPFTGSSYVVYVNNPGLQKATPEFEEYTQSMIDQITQIILDNANTFEDKSSLEGRNKASYVFSSDKDIAFYAYLNENILRKVSALPEVSVIEPNFSFDPQ